MAVEPPRNSADFFDLARRLEADARRSASADPTPGIARTTKPAEDPARFGQRVEMAFATGSVRSVDTNRHPPRVEVSFLGLLGPNGPLPLHLTEYALDRARDAGDRSLASFLDLFNNRVIGMFYRAWAAGQPAAAADHGPDDTFTDAVANLVGLGLDSLHNRTVLGDHDKLAYAAHLAQISRPAEGLRVAIESRLGLPVELEQCVTDWVPLPDDQLTRLGCPGATLGGGAAMGRRVPDAGGRFRLRVGPVPYARLAEMLPGGLAAAEIADWVSEYTRRQLAWDIQILVKGDEIPPTQLGAGGRLGWTTWLRCEPMHGVVDSLVLESERIDSARDPVAAN
ncbi:MAG: type VI secretion system baseplate subunit TssG [Planctomycetota bacterium]